MVAFSIFWFHIYRYGIFYAITFLLGYLYFFVIRKYSFFDKVSKPFYWLIKNNLDDILIYVMVWIILWGRLWHILIYDFDYYIHNPMHIFAIWEWWMSFIGGILWVCIALFLLAWKYKFNIKDFFVLADTLVVPVSFGIMIWRIGNFLNQELYGIVVPVDSRWLGDHLVIFLTKIKVFFVYSNIDNLIRLNTNFLASFFEGFCLLLCLLFMFFYQTRKKTRSIGLMWSFFLVWYSGIRFLLEYLRSDSQMEIIGIFSKSQWVFLVFFFIWLALISFRKKIFSYTIK